MKKSILIILVLLTLCLSLVADASAQNITLSLSAGMGNFGSNAEIYLSVQNNPGFCGAAFNVEFDENALEFVSCTPIKPFDPDVLSVIPSIGSVRIAFTDKTEDFTNDGDLFCLNFKIIANPTEKQISEIEIFATDGSFADMLFRDMTPFVTNGSVTIIPAGIELNPESKYILDRDNFLIKNVPAGTVPSDFISQFTGSLEIVGNQKFIGTGTKIRDTHTKEEYSVIVSGDLNGDGRITAADTLMLKKLVLNLSSPSDLQKISGDINADGRITAADVIKLKRFVLGT